MLEKKNLIILVLVALVFLSSGCSLGTFTGTSQTQPEEEKLAEFEGIGILNFDLKTGYTGNRINPGAQAFISLAIRNNALGDNAKNVIASIQNVDNIIDCQGNKWDPKVNRSREDVPDCEGNNFYTLNHNLRVNQQGISKIRPGEEIQFLYQTEIPSKEELAGISQEREIHYTLSYDYSKHMTYSVKAMSSEEFISRRRQKEEGVDVSHQYTSTAGAVEIEPDLPEPITYNLQGESPEYDLILRIKNKGKGLPTPGKNASLVVSFNKTTLNALEPGKYGWVKLEDGEGYIKYEKELTSSDIILENTKRFRFELDEEYLSSLQENIVPLTSFSFNFDLNYSYMRRGSETLQVIPIE